MRLRHLAILAPLTLALPLTARAQLDISLDLAPGNSAWFNRSQCERNATIALSYNIPAEVLIEGSKILVFAGNGSTCGDEGPAEGKATFEEMPISTSNNSGSVTIAVRSLTTECVDGREDDFYVCLNLIQPQLEANGTTTKDTVTKKDKLRLTYDSTPPAAPAITSLKAGDGSLRLGWNPIDEIDYFEIFYRTAGEAPVGDDTICTAVAPIDPVDAGPIAGEPTPLPFDESLWPEDERVSNGEATSEEIRGLVNNQRYQLTVVAVDLAGNRGPPSDTFAGTPQVVQDFYRRYRCAGGTEEGGFGCSTAGAVLLPAAGLAALALMRRRRKE